MQLCTLELIISSCVHDKWGWSLSAANLAYCWTHQLNFCVHIYDYMLKKLLTPHSS